MGDGDVELDFGEVDQQHAEPFGFHGALVKFQRELGGLRHRVHDGCLQIGHRPEQALAALGRAHDSGIVAGAGHDAEPEFPPARVDFAHVEVERAAGAHQLGQGMRFLRACQVQCQQVGGAGGEGQHRDVGVRQQVAYGGDGSVTARGDHDVEVARVVKQGFHRRGAVGGAQARLVAVAGEAAHEVVHGSFAVTGCQIVDDEQFHGFPFTCYIVAWYRR